MNLKLAALIAAILWGFTYILTTTILPHNPVFLGAVRSFLGGLALLALARQLPLPGSWPKLIVLGTLNFAVFFGLLFVGAIRLPGGIAGTFQTLTPLVAILLAWPLLGQMPKGLQVVSVLVGAIGVALVILRGDAALDAIGVMAAMASVISGSLGAVLINRWQKPAELSLLGFTAWQLIIGGVELGILALVLGDLPATLTAVNALGLVVLALFITALPFVLWFRAIAGMGAPNTAPFILLTPVVAFILDALIRGVVPSPFQALGVALVIAGLILNQWVGRRAAKPA